MLLKSGVHFIKYFNGNGNFLLQPKKCRSTVRLLSTSKIYQEKNDSMAKALQAKNEFYREERKKYENTFGNIESFERKFSMIEEDPDDIKEYERQKNAPGKTIRQYMREIKEHLEKHDYEKAIRALEIDMSLDKKPPISHIYDILISYNANLGNLKEAYRLFLQYRKRLGLPSGGMYTSMFEACANCKNSQFALTKLEAIRQALDNDKRININTTHYNVLLKAYGRHGDMANALLLFDEILKKRDKINNVAYTFLLQSCVTDTNSGLRHALLIWRKMLQNQVKPSIYTFNLLLRCVRECSMGEVQLLNNFVKQIKEESGKFFRKKIVYKEINGEKKRIVIKLPADSRNMMPPEEKIQDEIPSKVIDLKADNVLMTDSNESSEEVPESELETLESKPVSDASSSQPSLPNLLAVVPTTGSVISFGSMSEPHERLMCLGGVDGFLKVMTDFKVQPNIKTFTLLLDVIEPTVEAEEKLIAKIKEFNLKFDVEFFNSFIKKRNSRRDFDNIQSILQLMRNERISPDIVTFGSLAISCKTRESALDLINNIRSAGFRLNNQTLGALLKNAGYASDMQYVKLILDAVKEDDVQLEQRFLAVLGKIIRTEKYRRRKMLENKENTEKVVDVSTP